MHPTLSSYLSPYYRDHAIFTVVRSGSGSTGWYLSRDAHNPLMGRLVQPLP